MTETPREDLRQRRSKQHMSEALLGLMAERPYREISVVDICERAMVHRTTFYAHFEDKNALFRYVLQELQRGFEEEQAALAGQVDLRAFLLAEFHSALRFLKEHRQIYLSGLAGGGHELRMVEDTAAEWLTRRSREEGVTAGETLAPELAGQFYAGALLTVVRWWLENGMTMDEAELVKQVERLLPRQEEERG